MREDAESSGARPLRHVRGLPAEPTWPGGDVPPDLSSISVQRPSWRDIVPTRREARTESDVAGHAG